MKHLTVHAVFATAVLLLWGGPARAEMATFNYSWLVSPSAVLTSGTGSVDFALAAAGSSAVEVGSLTPAGIPAATVTTTSSADQTPDVFNHDFGLTLHLTHAASGLSGDLTFNGKVIGDLTATTSALSNTFDEPVTQTLALGGLLYSVTIDPVVTNLPMPGASAPVLLDALVTASLVDLPPPPRSDSPEPSSLVLGGSALLLLGLARRRMRRRES